MEFSYQFFLAIGGILLVGQAISALGKRTFLPRVTLLLLFGLAVGQAGLDIIPEFFTQRFEIVAEMTLLMVGFLIGGKLTLPVFQHGLKTIVCISACAAIVTAIVWNTVMHGR
jgi:Kef-type K+ transport system membrane component KefB